MSISDALIADIRRNEPRLTQLVSDQRPDHDRKSIRVAVYSGLTTAAVAVLNVVGDQSPESKAEIDRVVAHLPGSIGLETVRLDQVIIDPAVAAQAKAQIKGANMTDGPTALALAFNLCGQKDIKEMLSLHNGPMGPMGGIAAVLSQRLLGDDGFHIMMDSVEIVNSMAAAIAKGSGAQGRTKQGCAVVSMALLFGGAGLAGGAAALFRYLV